MITDAWTRLQDLRQDLQDSALASSTLRARTYQLRCYHSFCELYQLTPFPCSPDQACSYAAFLFDKLAPSSVGNYMSAVWYHQQYLGFVSHSHEFRVRMTLRGIMRRGHYTRLSRLPLAPSHLLKFYQLINTLLPEDLLFWSAVTLAFRALLRKSHYTPSPHVLLRSDIQLERGYMIIKIRTSKTDQFGHEPRSIVIGASPGAPLCPVYYVSELCRITNHSPSDLLFSIRGPAGLNPLSYSGFTHKLKALASTSGLDPSLVSPHSLRHGGASFLSALDLPLQDIMCRGNWHSDAVNLYIHDSVPTMLSRDSPVATKLASYF